MCEFCTQHGEGKKWYLQAKNYEREVLKGERRGGEAEFLERREEDIVKWGIEMDKLIASDFNAARAMLVSQAEQQKKQNWAQIVPIEDAEQILDMSTSIVRLSCICRKMLGVHNARFCFGLNMERRYLELVNEYPDYSKDFEEVTKEEAKKVFREFDHEGLVHLVLTQTPFIETICNCDSTYCWALRARARFNYQVNFFKAEYVSIVDWEKCNGCRECMKLCNFGAISYSPAVEKCYINQFKCCGCGVCRSACPTNAITLRDRNAIPVLAKEW
jgi:ferredoxin